MNEAGKRCRAAGLQFCYHHHSFEFVRYGDQRGWDVLVSRLDKDLVGFETDVFWLAAGGLDPAATIRELGSRVKLVHLKDRAAGPPELDESKVAKTTFKEVGSGTLDFPAILRAAQAVGVTHYFVEQDQVPADPLVSLKQSVTLPAFPEVVGTHACGLRGAPSAANSRPHGGSSGRRGSSAVKLRFSMTSATRRLRARPSGLSRPFASRFGSSGRSLP